MAKIINSDKIDKGFVLFPLSSLKILIEENDGISVILSSGINRLADNLETDIEDKARRYELAQAKLNLTGSTDAGLRRAAKVQQKDNEPLIMASVDFLLYARDELKPNEQQRMALAMLFGLKSIIGMRRKWAATTQDMIKARMFGYLTKDKKGFRYESKQLKDMWAKWTTRRRYESLVRWLQEARLLRCYVGTTYRRTIVSIDADWNSIREEVKDFFQKNQSTKMQARKCREELAQMMQVPLK